MKNELLINSFEYAIKNNRYPDLLKVLNPKQDVEKFFNESRPSIIIKMRKKEWKKTQYVPLTVYESELEDTIDKYKKMGYEIEIS